jgi:DnaJ-class molecular chaperone
MSLVHSSVPHPSPATIGAGRPAEYITSARAKSPPGSTAWHYDARGIDCTKCGGEGRKLWSRYGGNDPDVFDKGPCEACDGTGAQTCDHCGKDVAVATWKDHGREHLICRACHEEWIAEEES